MEYMHRAHDEVKWKLSCKEVNTNWQVSPRLRGMAHVTGLGPREGSGQEGTDVKRMLEGIGGGAEEQVCVWGVGRVAQKAKPDGIHSFENIQ